ncbi:eukaryotic translation initiation factor 4B3-like isoform X2 [Magnolia sinica]|uniref:eukaryotic translation initiation factor 4B3-like isoform X2 n=1 Tax=Magnolia sinica TaxID=86752 RepID=UPI0026582EB1|nr:eukaryotic translation initiation factor 4B3-like isoform X2 [Magnolia sinica]
MATVSAWGKPGAWALDSEEQEAKDHILQEQQLKDRENELFLDSSESTQQPLADFPSLAAAVTTKPSKKKKSQPVSLSEFTIGKQVTHGSGKTTSSLLTKGLTPDEQLLLPTGPRQRTAEELERSSSRIGGAFNSYSSSGPRRYPTEDQAPRRNNTINSGPSRADEIDDWGASKKSAPPPSFDRRDRGGFFDSQSRADESDSWVSTKSHAPVPEGRRAGSGGFEGFKDRKGGFDIFHKEGTNGGADSDSWGRKREEGSGSDSWGKKREEGSGSDAWGKKREEGSGSDAWGKRREEGSGGRPRLNLQPRTLPVTNGDPQQGPGKSKGSNPFGAARPREEVLAEKGQDWKIIDEQLESMKIKEMSPSAVSSDGPSFGKKSFGSGNGRTSMPEDRTERNWRKADSAADDTPSLAHPNN